MKPIKFKQQNCVIAKDQPEYISLPSYKDNDGIVTTCWKLSFLEKIKLLINGKIWLQVMTFKHPLQPIRLSIKNPLENENE